MTSAEVVDLGGYVLPQEPSLWPSLIGLRVETSSGENQSIGQSMADQSYDRQN